jgi:hypothetical protein
MVAEEESISPPYLYGRRRRIYISSIPIWLYGIVELILTMK